MRVLILSANTGGGHNSTAMALGEQMARRGIAYEIADTLSFISERVSDFVSWGHSYVYRRMPRLFGIGYRYEETHSVNFLYNQCSKGVDALYEKLSADPPDAILCTHVFSGLMMTELRLRYGMDTPCYFIATDYTCSPGVSRMNLDGYFIPHEGLTEEFIREGIAAEKLFATGIPVGECFYCAGDRLELRKQLGLPPEKRVILLGCGSMGCGKLERVAKLLLFRIPKDACLVVLCGRNEKAYQALRQCGNERLIALSFVQNVSDYMSASDIYLTKPGGLTTTEAIAQKTPMILVNAVPGCETRNYHFLTSRGVAFGAKSWQNAGSLLKRLLQSDEEIGRQKDAMERFGVFHSAEEICRILLQK